MRRIVMALLAAVMLLALCVIPACAENETEAQNAELDAAFAGKGRLLLEPVTLDENASSYAAPLALSPDGRTILWRSIDLFLTRDETIIPITFNAGRGVGDPYGKEKVIGSIVRDLPSWEGLSWSEDGRYIAVSDSVMGMQKMKSIDCPVLDTVSGEIYFADSYNGKIREEDGGSVFLSAIDRSGRYVYYLLYASNENEKCYRFCRCAVEGGQREVLYETPYDRSGLMDVAGGAKLFEASDGSWVLSGLCGSAMGKTGRIGLIRFYGTDNGWAMDPVSMGIPYGIWQVSFASWSARSGYGLICLTNPYTAQSGSEENEQELWRGAASHVNLLRVCPGEDMPHDVWYLIQPDPESERVEMVSGEDFLLALKIKYDKVEAGEEKKAAEWLASEDADPDNPFPEGYDRDTFIRETDQLMNATCACISPDGYYALINAGTHMVYHLYLVKLETMEVLPVDAPEEVGGLSLTNTVFGTDYRPGMVWNEDGTLLIQREEGTLVGAFRLRTSE